MSNRVALPTDRSARAGGLAIALRDMLQSNGGLWFGCADKVADSAGEPPSVLPAGQITYVTVPLSRAEHEDYYLGFANGMLWPLFHFRLGLVDYRRGIYQVYRSVNAHLAGELMAFLKPDDVVWVQDFHLIPLGYELRKLGAKNRIGFFLHTPFPPAEVLSVLPHNAELLETMCHYDLVGFQTADDVECFRGCLMKIARGRALDGNAVAACGRRFAVAVFPIGIDTAAFAELAKKGVHSAETRRLRESLVDRKFIIGVDRLDYSKGIANRFNAIDVLLTDSPEHRRKFSYLQIAPHSRSEIQQYRALRREIESTAGRVNGKFGEFDWVPIRYVNKSFSRQSIAGFCRQAHVGLVTPLRDGMNLIAKEYIAAQDPESPGVLVLSRFAGAAREFETALLVNPFDVDEIAVALDRGLSMPLDERRERWRAMMDVITRNTVVTWRESFLAALQKAEVNAVLA